MIGAPARNCATGRRLPPAFCNSVKRSAPWPQATTIPALSAASTGAFPTLRWTDLLHLAAHMFLVGVPCAWFARLALRGASPTA